MVNFEEILDYFGDEYYNTEDYQELISKDSRRSDDSWTYDEEKKREAYAKEVISNIYCENGKPLTDYTYGDEFITDYENYFIPVDEWKDFVELNTLYEYFEKDDLWNKFWEYLNLAKNIIMGYGINFTSEEINNEMLNFIEENLDDYFEFAWNYEKE